MINLFSGGGGESSGVQPPRATLRAKRVRELSDLQADRTILPRRPLQVGLEPVAGQRRIPTRTGRPGPPSTGSQGAHR